MGRTTNNTYITPIVASTGAEATFAPGADTTLTGRGVYTLQANTTYFYIIDGKDAELLFAHLQFDAAIVITAAQVEDCGMADTEVLDYDVNTTGAWVPETPSTAYVGTVGAGTSVSASGVVSTAGSAAGACTFHIADTAARRTRISVQVGGTGGEARLGTWGKE